jgi:hypothetical protein
MVPRRFPVAKSPSHQQTPAKSPSGKLGGDLPEGRFLTNYEVTVAVGPI